MARVVDGRVFGKTHRRWGEDVVLFYSSRLIEMVVKKKRTWDGWVQLSEHEDKKVHAVVGVRAEKWKCTMLWLELSCLPLA